MKKIIISRIFAVVLALIFVLSAAFALVSCSNDDEKTEGTPITITLEVVGPDGTSKEHSVKTDA